MKDVFERLFHYSPIAIEQYGPDGDFKKCNHAALDVFGISDYKQIVRYNLFEEPNLSDQQISDIKSGRKTRFELVYDFGKINQPEVYKTIKNGIAYLDCQIIPTKSKDNVITDIFIYIIDITDKKKAEQSLKENEEQLRQLNATKDKLFSIIAHDLRSPFNSILGFVEFMIDNVGKLDVKEIEKYLNIINSSTQNTLVLLNNLLDWAKSQTNQISFNPDKILFSDVIQEIKDLSISPAKSKNISLHYVYPDHIELYADENMLKTILRNLVSNALKFTNLEGIITITVKEVNDNVEISVSDNGIGMSEEIVNALFDISVKKSSMGTSKEKGSGLGLILCKELVEIHKGKIWVESKIGQGSVFRFTMPVSDKKV